jgi:hypothetical protein
MHTKLLFPTYYKKIGWLLLIPGLLFGLFSIVCELLPYNVVDPYPILKKFSVFNETNLINELEGVFIIIGSIFVAFSRERDEDELTGKTRSESLVWSIYVNYIVALITLLLVYNSSYLYVMTFNIFTPLFFFIIRFNWQLRKLKKGLNNEE